MRKEDFPFKENDILDFAITIDLKEYQGQEQLSVIIKDVRPSNINDDEVLSQILLYESYFNNKLDNEDAKLLYFDRNELVIAYKAIKSGANSITKLNHSVPELMDAKLRIMVDVLEELNLISTNYIGTERYITLLNAEKVQLENSAILNELKRMAVTQ